ncbi:MAG: DUF2207 domain-containing protein [Thermoflexales bacterium]|nr:DUF2207 domain-containing protein [Thermoflexales bacterium]
MKRQTVLILSVLIPVALFALPDTASAQTKSLIWERLDTDITVEPNGDLRIVETNVIRFTEGRFTFGFREFDLSRMAGVEDLRVSEGDIPLEIETERDSNALLVKYYFASPAERETRTFTLRYRVRGALRYYPDGDQLWWKAVYADRSGFAVQQARVTVRLPAGAQAERAEVYGVRAELRGLGESLITAEALEAIPNGDEMEVRVQFPHGVVSGEPAPWQRAFDERQRFVEAQKPFFDALTLLASLAIFFGGPALAAVLYVTRGRDPNVGLVAEYLTEPPSIPPGLGGALQDEFADIQDIVATLVDLARRGVITLREFEGKHQMDWQIASSNQSAAAELLPYERVLLNALGLLYRSETSIASLRNTFYMRLPEIQNAIYDELVRRGYYTTSPERVRARYRALAGALGLVTLFVGIASIVLLAELTSFAICLPLALGVTAVGFWLIAPHMPVRTRAGAEMRMRVAAFKRYLQNIEKYTELDKHTELFERYLPWAIALGLRQSWVNKFKPLPVPPPTWYAPYPTWAHGSPLPTRGMREPVLASAGSPGSLPRQVDISEAAHSSGGFADFERSLGSSLSSLERNLGSMFDTLARNMTSQPAASRSSRSSFGGWSGGGSFGGGGSGGGRGGFG